MFFLQIAFLALCTAPSFVSAHINPIVPTAGAQYQGGQTQTLKWSYNSDDTAGNPFVTERFKCDLMWSDGHWVTLLARNLSIYDGWVTVLFRPDYGFDSTAYYIRYMTEESGSAVNTDRFTLSQMNGTNFSQLFNEQPDPNIVSHGSGGSHPASNAQMGSASVAQATPSSYKTLGQTARLNQAGSSPTPTGTHPTSTSSSSGFIEGNQSTSNADGLVGPLGAPPTPSLDDTEDSEPTSKGSQSGAVSLRRQRESSWQKVSLALWPVLVGAVMAV
ncbi:hypothetical protein RSOL_435460 [Rhizoctonia solani AG-3 Rhs1AP]|uniref:Ser-Thr-rich glycosyl-phosphatidyl-inositol-anchored membrane family-domain-containing protein n=1 Tax=Rhizoctonia solani AG-3 Rhs1AP TaxID=1086054 RepID=X8JLM7_9AGAM|nr:hypothetical protein RSOL_435460 [Rhizoctonia solani AG-3 Rhs1AP]